MHHRHLPDRITLVSAAVMILVLATSFGSVWWAALVLGDGTAAGAARLLEAHLPQALVPIVAGTLVAGTVVLSTRTPVRALADERATAALAARTDTLTGLPNRLGFTEHLETLAGASAGEVAVLYIDVNDFKTINDAVGHAGGDRLIVALAGRLAQLGGDGDFMARIGGDEFVFLVHRDDAERRVRDLGLLVRERMSEPIILGSYPFTVSLAQGFAVWQGPGTGTDVLVHEADLAMYHAKRHKIDSAVRYDRAIEAAHRETQVIEEALRRALARPGEFHVLYQPIVDLRTGRMVKAEALARWTSAELGRVPPEKFVAAAEKSGLIVDVGRRLLDLICADLAHYPELNVSINFSPLQLQAPAFIPELIDLMHRRRIETFRVEVELTEGVIVDNPEVSAFRLDLLNEAGFSTALDDFGTGYSSLGYLRHMPFNTLKIDRSFVSGLKAEDANADLIRAIAVLGHSLNQSVVAEGVETEAEVALLRDLGCDLLQGFHFDRPLPIDVLAERWIERKVDMAG